MVKSKRNKVVPLTKTKKKVGQEKKDKIHEKTQACIDNYDYIYTFKFRNMTTMPMQELRKYWRTST